MNQVTMCVIVYSNGKTSKVKSLKGIMVQAETALTEAVHMSDLLTESGLKHFSVSLSADYGEEYRFSSVHVSGGKLLLTY